jgi:hypothetical protein
MQVFLQFYRNILIVFFLIILTGRISAQQKLIPLSRIYSQEIERTMLSDSTLNFHSGTRPYIESDIDLSNVHGFRKDSTKLYTKEAVKLFKAHLFEIKKEDFFLALDPLFDFTLGKDIADTSWFRTQKMLTNQRGAQLIGDIGKKFSFQTSFYETQIVVPMYLKTYSDSMGIFPGWGRTKDYNGRGYDFGVSTGWISYRPNENLHFQFGNGKNFYGHGYRSVLWSDAAFSYPYIKATYKFADDKLQYSSMYASLQTLERLPLGEVPEALFKRKGASINYLSYKPNSKIEIGLYESIIWVRYDSTGTRPQPYGAYIPVIGVNSAINGMSGKQNAILGMNLSLKISRHASLYAQVGADDFKNQRFAWQAGFKYFDLGLKNLDVQFEWNSIGDYFYASQYELQSYSHFNQPLGHPTGPSTNELLLIFNYRYHRLFAQVKVNQIIHSTGSEGNWSSDPENVVQYFEAWPQKSILQADAEFGILFNPKTNFQILAGYTNRRETIDYNHIEDVKGQTSFLYVSLRTNLINRYADF